MHEAWCLQDMSSYIWSGSMLVQYPEKQEAFKMQMLRNLYGSGLPARTQLDKQILSK